MDKTVIILTGASGSGKSTWANNKVAEISRMSFGMQTAVLSTDDFFVDENGKYIFDREKLGIAHKWNYNRFLSCLENYVDLIIIDNINTTVSEIKKYAEPAFLRGYTVELITVEGFTLEELIIRNKHNVPPETIKKQLERIENLKRIVREQPDLLKKIACKVVLKALQNYGMTGIDFIKYGYDLLCDSVFILNFNGKEMEKAKMEEKINKLNLLRNKMLAAINEYDSL